MRILILLCILIVEVAATGVAHAQVTAAAPPPASKAVDPFEKQIRKTVSFITMKCQGEIFATGAGGHRFLRFSIGR